MVAKTQSTEDVVKVSLYRSPWFYLAVVFAASWLYFLVWKFFPTAPLIEDLRIWLFHLMPGVRTADNTARAVVLPLITVIALLLLRYLKLPQLLSLRTVLVGSTLLLLPLFFTPPLGSSDVYAYGYYGRLVSVHKENPYTIAGNADIHDPFLQATLALHPFQTNYGPLWTAIEALVMRVAQSSLQAGVFLFRAIAVASFLASSALLWKMLPAEKRDRRLLLFAWNPYVLFEVGSNAHNDVFMMLWILLMLYAFHRQWYIFSLLALTVAILTKFVPLFLFPLLLLATVRKKPGRRTWYAVGIGVMLSALLTAFAFLPFWSGWETFQLMAMLGATFSLPVYHPLLLLAWVLQATFLPNPHVVTTVVHGLGIVAFVLLLVRTAQQILRRAGRNMNEGTMAYFFGFLALAMTFYQPWYLLWIFPLVVLWQHPKTLPMLAVLSILGSVTYAIF